LNYRSTYEGFFNGIKNVYGGHMVWETWNCLTKITKKQSSSTFKCHYDKLCLQKLHYFATRAFKQLICNYIATIPWKYQNFNVVTY
jgi:hypothetical protein